MTLARVMAVRSAIEDVGWTIEEPTGNIYEVFDEQLVWIIRYRDSKKTLRLIFQLVDDFGNRTDRLADILFFKIEGDEDELFFQKINSNLWKNLLDKLKNKISLIAATQ